MRRNIVRVMTLAAVIGFVGCKVEDHSGDGLCSLLGPCGYGSQPLPVSLVVGFPDSLVSTDPANEIGVMPVDAVLTLRYVQATSKGMSGPSIFALGCTSNEVVRDSLRWAVSDSTVAAIAGTAGYATLRARTPGTFTVLTTNYQASPVPPEVWVPRVVACPSGRVLNLIRVR